MRRLFAALAITLLCLSPAGALETDDYGFPIESAYQPSFSSRTSGFNSVQYRPSYNNNRFIFRSARTRQYRPVGVQQQYVIQSQPVVATQSPAASTAAAGSAAATPTTTATPLPAAK
ncbi:MAG: hypothetical protein AAF497_09170 [Planctomycetota bacterium]